MDNGFHSDETVLVAALRQRRIWKKDTGRWAPVRKVSEAIAAVQSRQLPASPWQHTAQQLFPLCGKALDDVRARGGG